MRYLVRHQTTYRYSDPVQVSINQVCLRPRSSAGQTLLRHALAISPASRIRTEWTDFFGNLQVQYHVSDVHREMTILAESEVDVHAREWPDPDATSPWESARAGVAKPATDAALDASQYRFDSPMIGASAALLDYARPSFPAGRPLLAALADLTARIKTEFVYDTAATTLTTKVEDVLDRRRGVCQDFAQVQIGCLRSIGLAARYVSGYLLTRPPPGRPRLVGADASHCWVSVFSPDLGWLDVDPTNGSLVGDEHVAVAWGRDYHDVTPVKGVILGGGHQDILVAVDVIPEDEGLPDLRLLAK